MNHSFDAPPSTSSFYSSTTTPFQSTAGYSGAICLFLLAFSNYFFLAQNPLNITITAEQSLIFSVAICVLVMLIHEVIQRRRFNRARAKNSSPQMANPNPKTRSHFQLIKSCLFRYVIYLGLIALPWLIISQHYYFQDSSFNSTRLLYTYLLYLYLFLGLPYIYLTLRLKPAYHYELNDYALLTLIGVKSLFFTPLLNRLRGHRSTSLYKNRRIKKIALVFLVNFFFLTLMSKFLLLEYQQFAWALGEIISDNFGQQRFFVQYHTIYLLCFHLIFIIDVGLAIIGYSIASRWLDNRTKSVDMTFYGWFVVLLCYPPMNAGFTDQFIGYGRIQTEQLITSEIGLMIIMPLILTCFFVYVWATAALGFKFSNLTNRGVVHIGPYGWFRHPAYTSKNLAWWIDNTYVLSNIWAALALLAWNVIYLLRGLTEEQHLQKDKHYLAYQKKVPGRFFPYFKGLFNFSKTVRQSAR